MKKFEYIAGDKVSAVIKEVVSDLWPQSEVGKRILLTEGRWAQNEARVSSVKLDYDIMQEKTVTTFELQVLFSEKVPGAADLITHVTEEDYKEIITNEQQQI